MFATLVGAYPRSARASDEAHVRLALADQIDAGLGLLTDGRAAAVPGEDAVERWRAADSVARELAAERRLEPLPVKVCVAGPYTLGRASDLGASARERETLALAESIGQVIRASTEAGAPVAQIDEDALTMIGKEDDAERALATAALDRLTAVVAGLPHAHLCLAVSGGNAEFAGAALFFERPFSSHLFDLVAGPDNWRLIARAPRDRGIVCGVADARIETRDEEAVMIWGARYAATLGGRGLDRVGLAPSAGLEHLLGDRAKAKIEALGEAARKAGLPGQKLAQEIEPRAVDARSAALGRVDPAP